MPQRRQRASASGWLLMLAGPLATAGKDRLSGTLWRSLLRMQIHRATDSSAGARGPVQAREAALNGWFQAPILRCLRPFWVGMLRSLCFVAEMPYCSFYGTLFLYQVKSPMSKPPSKTTILDDGLRYKSKVGGSPFVTSLDPGKSTMSCFMCGKHWPRSEMMTRKLIGKSQAVCAPNCQ